MSLETLSTNVSDNRVVLDSGSSDCSPVNTDYKQKEFFPGDQIVTFMFDESVDKTKKVEERVEVHGWYCGKKGDWHVYLLKGKDGEIFKWETARLSMCHVEDLEEERNKWSRFINEAKSANIQSGK